MVKPILFNTEMVRAIRDGRKTVARLVVNPQPRSVYFDGGLQIADDETFLIADDKNGGLIQIVPQYSPSDILYVRETWAENPHPWDGAKYVYRANIHPADYNLYKWRPSIHMPREAARIFLRVTDVRVERLQEMRAEDSLREGVKLHLECCLNGEAPLKPFADLWDSTIKPEDRERYGWAANPFCWVISFERIGKDEAMQQGSRD